MKLAIDISSVVYGTGVSVYTKNLVQALAKIDKENQYILFAGTLRQSEGIRRFYTNLKKKHVATNFDLKIFPLPPKLQTIIWNDWHILPLEWWIGKVDVYHSPDWSLAPTQTKTVITIHDLFFLKRPDLQQHPYRATLEKKLKRARDKRIPAIAVSKATKADLIQLLNYPQELITVIYEAIDTNFTRVNPPRSHKGVQKKYHLPEKYLLMVATQEPRKNLQKTIEAFNDLKPETRNLKLIIAGKTGWGDLQLPQHQHVQFLGYVPQEDLPPLYAHAQGSLYPSLYEGFGLPILEAFACGCPVLTSNVSSMPEVAGPGAIYVNPHDANSIRQGIQKMLDLKSADKKRLIENGYQEMKKFSWEKAARETLKLYQSL